MKKGKAVENGKFMKSEKMDGYFTVEAAMVLPIVIGTIIFIIYVQLYWYDRCLMDQETAMLAMQAAHLYRDDMEKTGEALKEWREENITEKYVGWQKDDLIISKKFDRIILQQKGRFSTDRALWDAGVRYENRLLNPVAFLRLCRRMEK